MSFPYIAMHWEDCRHLWMVSESLEEKEAETKKIVKEGNSFEGAE